MEELEKTNEQINRDLEIFKNKYVQKTTELEKVNYELLIKNKEINLEIKQQKILTDIAKNDYVARIKSLENEKLSLENKINDFDGVNNGQTEKVKLQMEIKLHEA